MAELKISFGLGTLVQALGKIGETNNGLLAFGADENYGAIVAQGKLVTSRVLDFTWDDDAKKLSLTKINNNNTATETADVDLTSIIAKQVQDFVTESDVAEIVKGEVEEQLDVDSITQEVLDALKEAIKGEGDNSEIKDALIEAIKEAVSEDVEKLQNWAKSSVVTAEATSPIKVTASKGDGEYNTYKLDIEVDGEVIKVEDGKLTADLTEVLKDKFVKAGSYDKESKEIVLEIENADSGASEVRIDVKDLVPKELKEYTGKDGEIEISESNEISLASAITSKLSNVDKLMSIVLGETEYDTDTDADEMIPLIDFIRSLTTKIDSVETAVEDIEDLSSRLEDLEETINGTDGDGLSKKVEDLETKVNQLKEQQDNDLVWGTLD